MKKLLAIILSLVMMLTVVPMSVFAADATSGTCGDNLTWTFDEETGTLTISGEGEMYNYDSDNRPWESYEDAIKTVVIGDSVTTIGTMSFAWCDNLTSIMIGNSVTTIGGWAFENCTSLTSITIPDSVTKIEGCAFIYCTNLTSVTIPYSVTTIGTGAFGFCDSITNMEIDADNQHYSVDSFGALYNKSKTELILCTLGNERIEFTIPDSVTTIEDYAFSSCNSLIRITVPKSVTTIGDYVFFYCPSLADVYYKGTYENWKNISIGSYNYYLSDVATIHYNASEDDGLSGTCGENLTWTFDTETAELSIDGTGEMYDYDGDNRPWESYEDAIKTVVIGDSVTTIGTGTFYDCNSLTSVTIGKSITTFGDRAFTFCTNLTSVTIPDSVTSIEKWVFSSCDSLTDVYYNGTEEKWNKIKIDDDNEPLLNATIHFIEPEKPYSGTCGDNLAWALDAETGEFTISGIGNMSNYSATSPAPWDEYKDQIKKISVFEGVTTIGNDTFIGCKNLEEISLPSTLSKIGDSAFRDCAGLKDIEISENVKSLGHYAFYGCYGLTELNVGNGVQTIGNYAFRKCSNLKSVTLPETLTRIGKGAFMECPSLFEAEYKGTDEQWTEVTVGENNEALLDALKGIVLGDVNGDGKINSLDALYCLNHATEKTILEGKTFLAADVDKNGKVNSMDALKILNFAVGKITEI